MGEADGVAAVLGGDRPVVPSALTIGVLDGVHRGHARLLQRTAAQARRRGLRALAITLDPHPRCVLDPDHCPQLITTLRERRDLVLGNGIDDLVVLPFSHAVSRWSAETFCDGLVEHLGLRHLVIGHDFALGHGRQGDEAFLRAYGRKRGFGVSVVGAVRSGGEPVSSGRVRETLAAGDISGANRLLGHPHILDGVVVHGNHVGRRLGFPTANLDVGANRCLPGVGVYCGWVHVRGRWHRAAASVGYRPTFGDHRLSVEWHLLDFDDDIYGEWVRAAFTHRLRDERRFPSEAALITQMRRDVGVARRRLAALPEPAELTPGR